MHLKDMLDRTRRASTLHEEEGVAQPAAAAGAGGQRIMTMSLELDGTQVEGVDIVLAAETTTEQRFALAQAIKNSTIEICARPEFAKITVDVTGFR